MQNILILDRGGGGAAGKGSAKLLFPTRKTGRGKLHHKQGKVPLKCIF